MTSKMLAVTFRIRPRLCWSHCSGVQTDVPAWDTEDQQEPGVGKEQRQKVHGEKQTQH